MIEYILKRLIWTPFLLLIASFFVFFMGNIAPGDPAELILKNRATPEKIEALRDDMGLDEPFIIQYLIYIKNALGGDFGESYVFHGKKVTELLIPKLLVSIKLNIAVTIVSISLGVPLGFYAAKNYGSWKDPTIVLTMLFLFAMPVFFTAPFLITIFAVKLGWIKASGWNGFFDTQIILPALTIGIPSATIYVRHMRASTLDIIGQDYIRSAYSKGLKEYTIDTRHIIKNSNLPILTLLGFTIAGIFGGSLIVEIIYGIPGVSRLALDAIYQRDFPVLTALVLIGSTMLVLANLIIDIAYTLIDPRID